MALASIDQVVPAASWDTSACRYWRGRRKRREPTGRGAVACSSRL